MPPGSILAPRQPAAGECRQGMHAMPPTLSVTSKFLSRADYALRAPDVSEAHGGKHACFNCLHNEPFGSGRHDRSLGCSRRSLRRRAPTSSPIGTRKPSLSLRHRARWRDTVGLHGSAHDGDGPRRDVRRGQFDRAALPTLSGAAACGPRPRRRKPPLRRQPLRYWRQLIQRQRVK